MGLNAKLYNFYLSFQIPAAKAGKNSINHDCIIFLTWFMLMLMFFTMISMTMSMMIVIVFIMLVRLFLFNILLFVFLIVRMWMRVIITRMFFWLSLKSLLLLSKVVLYFYRWFFIKFPKISWAFLLHLNIVQFNIYMNLCMNINIKISFNKYRFYKIKTWHFINFFYNFILCCLCLVLDN